jgi:guanylate kinase
VTDHDLIADIEVSGAAKVRAAYPHNTIIIFIKPPSLEVLAERMRARGEQESGIADRMQRATREMTFANQCNYVIVNDEGEKEKAAAIEHLYNAIVTERRRRELAIAHEMNESDEDVNAEHLPEPQYT